MPFVPLRLSLSILLLIPLVSVGQEVDEIIVSGSPLSGEIDPDSPMQVQTFSSDEIHGNHSNSIADFLNASASGVSMNQAQNNPLQPDLQLRGYTASPLLGAAQGVAVYLNGVRTNEPFGDTVNWDLLPLGNIQQMTLLSGANASYGLNALGGAIAIESPTGFSADGTQLSLSSGSFGRNQASAQYGNNDGRWGVFVGIDAFDEDGWRDFSPSSAYNGYGSISLHDDNLEWDTFALVSDTDLYGNGASPEELLEFDRAAVFTHPDITENSLWMLSSRLHLDLSSGNALIINGFYRNNQTDSFNGDGSEFEECDPPDAGFLCEEDDDDLLEDQDGNPVPELYDAINNVSTRGQTSFGGTLEYALPFTLADQKHLSQFGLDFYQGDTEFRSAVEVAELQTDRSTNRTGIYVPDEATKLDTSTQTIGVYWLDKFFVSNNTAITASLRYNSSHVETKDRSGTTPELNGDHRFNTLNGGIGINHQLNEQLSVYAGINQSSRSPSPVELACSHEDAPCNLPNTFVADPPLDEAIAHNFELGFRSRTNEFNAWGIHGFISRIKDDILFQSTGGVSSNEGFFANISDTQRAGLSTEWETQWRSTQWTLEYTFLAATFEDNFTVSSPNHPDAVNDQIPVNAGDHIPGLPEHNLRLGLDWQLSQKISWQWDVQYQSGVYLRGDEGNLDKTTGNATTANTQINYRPNDLLTLWLAVDNVFDAESESFGLYGEPDEVIPSLGDENTRFLSPNAPRGAWAGVRVSW